MSAVIRSFVAIELNESTRRALTTLQRDLATQVPHQSIRWIAPESLHVTLQFLGDVPYEKIAPIVDALRKVCVDIPAFSFDLVGLGVFPNPRRPRIVWVGVYEPKGVLVTLHQRVGRVLSPLGFPPEERTFTPHLTIGRASRHASPAELRAIGELVTRMDVGLIETVPVERIVLMKSDLRPDGAVYTPQAILPLATGHSLEGRQA
ncbi:MAG: RNA 2',3'-cyclic phosphodiesterase [Ardenticatenia bacterium]|jgi:2'-5' RNA ligase|nr:MAG: RNA 2',3'-cyclic phosphodiesterase [Ardenticatenia bacterium]